MKDTIQRLVEALGDLDPQVRRDAARKLGRIGPEAVDAVPALREAKKDPRVFAAAAIALNRIIPKTSAQDDDWGGNDALGG